jgi:hypothetical protein
MARGEQSLLLLLLPLVVSMELRFNAFWASTFLAFHPALTFSEEFFRFLLRG